MIKAAADPGRLAVADEILEDFSQGGAYILPERNLELGPQGRPGLYSQAG